MIYHRKFIALFLAFSFLIPASAFANESGLTAEKGYNVQNYGSVEKAGNIEISAADIHEKENSNAFLQNITSTFIPDNSGISSILKTKISYALFLKNKTEAPEQNKAPQNKRPLDTNRHNSNGLGIGITGTKKEDDDNSEYEA